MELLREQRDPGFGRSFFQAPPLQLSPVHPPLPPGGHSQSSGFIYAPEFSDNHPCHAERKTVALSQWVPASPWLPPVLNSQFIHSTIPESRMCESKGQFRHKTSSAWGAKNVVGVLRIQMKIILLGVAQELKGKKQLRLKQVFLKPSSLDKPYCTSFVLVKVCDNLCFQPFWWLLLVHAHLTVVCPASSLSSV